MARFDDYDYDRMPHGMREYLSYHGYHFSKPMAEWAVGMMRDKNGNKVQMRTKEQVDSILKSHNAEVENAKGYDAMYTLHMAISDFLGSSIADEAHAALYVKDLIGDNDGYDGIVFTRFLADCSAKGIPIPWEELL